MKSNLLNDQTAVITGCSRGIGRSILENFALNGANCIACVRKKDEEFVNFCKDLSSKYKVNIDMNFSILVNMGPGSFSSLRSSLVVAKGIRISKKINLFGYKNSDLSQFNLDNIDLLIRKNLVQKNLIKLIYLS